ncbi:MAG: GEVED domain-containing protein, partial [Lysobacteraceae bacterium]
MQKKITQQRNENWLSRVAMIFSFIIAFTFSLNAQTYFNGNMGTGTINKAGAAAPAGVQWHEMMNNIGNNITANASLAYNCSGAFKAADNFTVPAGETWTISGMSFYTIQITASTPTAIGVAIRNGSPLAGGTVVFGNLATNVYSSSAPANVQVITSSANPTTAPFAATLNVTEQKVVFGTAAVLTAGTYWVEWNVTAPTNTFNIFSEIFGARTQPGYNALQQNGAAAYTALTDAGTPAGVAVPVDLNFKINYTSTGGTACTGTPAPGATLASATAICPGLPFNLSLATPTTGTGVTYQWQSGASTTGPWTNIAGATNATLTYSLAATTHYRCVVTCGTNTGNSTPVQVSMSTGCYCTPSAINCNLDDRIANVTFGTLNNTSGTTCTAGYSNYTALPAPNAISGATNPISVTVGPGGTEHVGVWIDYNQNGTFEVSEFTYLGSANGATISNNIIIPATALLGTTRMRVRVQYNTAVTATMPCTQTSTFGEVEDYNVNIVPCIPVTITTAPANATAVCGGNASFSVVAAGSIPAYQWQSKSTVVGSLWTNIAGATSATLNLTGVTGALSGYQYRVLFSGACTSPNVTTAATLTVNPITAAVTPTSALLCQGGVQQLTITNIASPSPGSVTVNSSYPTPIAIPDGSVAGISNVLPVVVPAGATVTGVSVRMSGTHQWFGDLVMALKAPNGNVINLNYYLGVTGGPGATSVFTNTVISSTGTASLGTAVSPFTGTFKADLVTAAGIGTNGPGGPTGFAPTGTTWLGFLPTTAAAASGNWTLAMYDGFAPDAGALANWSITVNYVLGSPATGVYTGPTGTIYTDAAATVPYTGTAIN